jgi:hypothetical protein
MRKTASIGFSDAGRRYCGICCNVSTSVCKRAMSCATVIVGVCAPADETGVAWLGAGAAAAIGHAELLAADEAA